MHNCRVKKWNFCNLRMVDRKHNTENTRQIQLPLSAWIEKSKNLFFLDKIKIPMQELVPPRRVGSGTWSVIISGTVTTSIRRWRTSIATISVIVVVISTGWSILTIISFSSISWITHVNTGSWRMCSLSNWKIDPNTTTIDLHSCALLFGSFRIVVIFVIHETEATWTTGFSVEYYLDAFKISIFREYITNLTFGRVNAESKNAQASVRLRMIVTGSSSFASIPGTSWTASMTTRIRPGLGLRSRRVPRFAIRTGPRTWSRTVFTIVTMRAPTWIRATATVGSAWRSTVASGIRISVAILAASTSRKRIATIGATSVAHLQSAKPKSTSNCTQIGFYNEGTRCCLQY